LELQHAEALIAAGERVLPLLLVGETRCGKTSLLCSIANRLGLTVYRLSLATVVGGYVGDAANKLHAALDEARMSGPALWLIDEIDGVAMHRCRGDGAAQERAHAVAAMLAEIESLPPGFMLAATSNTRDLIDDAVLARFSVVEFPKWTDLPNYDKQAFAVSHGSPNAFAKSYAECVQYCRKARVAKILESAP
jgi:AAA+ superfamily predicted ATPase